MIFTFYYPSQHFIIYLNILLSLSTLCSLTPLAQGRGVGEIRLPGTCYCQIAEKHTILRLENKQFWNINWEIGKQIGGKNHDRLEILLMHLSTLVCTWVQKSLFTFSMNWTLEGKGREVCEKDLLFISISFAIMLSASSSS